MSPVNDPSLPFADDTTVVARKPEHINTMTTTMLKIGKILRFLVNTAKSGVCIFDKGGDRNKDTLWSVNDDLTLKCKEFFEFLGVSFQQCR